MKVIALEQYCVRQHLVPKVVHINPESHTGFQPFFSDKNEVQKLHVHIVTALLN